MYVLKLTLDICEPQISENKQEQGECDPGINFIVSTDISKS